MGVFDQVKSLFALKVAPPLKVNAAATLRKPDANYSRGVEAYFEELVKFGWRRNELIFATITKTARTAAQIELKVYDKKTGEELPDHPLKKLIQRPNPEMSEYDLWSSIISYQKLAGVAHFEKERSFGGDVIRLWPLRPDWLKPKMANALQVESYRYKPTNAQDYVDLDPSSVLSFRLWDPAGMFTVWPPAAVAARAYEVDNDVTDLMKAFFQEGGMPAGLLKTPGRLREDQITEMRSRWRIRYGGWRQWLDPAILDSGAEFQRIGLTFKEMGFDTLDARNEARICMVMDVPPILLGAKIGLDRSTMANYKEARSEWWEDTLVPMYSNMLDVLMNGLLPEFEDADNIILKWDFSRVSSLQEEQSARWTRAISALGSGGITLNEFREEIGKQPIGEDGEVFIRTGSMIPIPVVGSGTFMPPAPPKEESIDAEADVEDADEEDVDSEDIDEEGTKNFMVLVGDHYSSKATSKRERERAKMEKQLTADLVEYFKGQQERIKKELEK